MVLYSIVDIGDVLSETSHSTDCYKSEIKKIKHGFIELDNSTSCNKGRIKRLYSTDPALYLDKRYYPF